MWIGLFQLTPLDGAVILCHGAAEKVKVLRLLHCLSEGTGSGSDARFSVIPSLSPAHSLSRPPWRPQKASSPVRAASESWASLFSHHRWTWM